MAKLYWRIKRNGKWTWKAATAENSKYVKLDANGYRLMPKDYHHLDDDLVDKPEVYTDE